LLLQIEADAGAVGDIVAHQRGVGAWASAIASENKAARPWLRKPVTLILPG
jgi:hypothetical protein